MVHKIQRIEASDLIENINFISKGLNWSDNRKRQVINYIVKANRELGFYGYSSRNESNICGAMLTPYQGRIEDCSCVSYMALYFEREHRGLEVYKFCKLVTSQIKEEGYTISSFSPSRATRLLLGSVGFKSMNSYEKRWHIFCLLYTSPSPRDVEESRMPSSA